MERIDEFLEHYPGTTLFCPEPCRWILTYKKRCQENGKLSVDVRITWYGKDSIEHYEEQGWIEHGQFKPNVAVIEVTTYVKTKNDGFVDIFNPQYEFVPDLTKSSVPTVAYLRHFPNFNWILEANEENMRKILTEIERQAFRR